MATPAAPSGGGDRAYKRSWKNLLINKRYQLRFTLFMVGLSAALMVGLGVWVMRVANETTTVGIARLRGKPCPKLLALGSDSGAVDPDTAPIPMQLDDGAELGSGSGNAGSGSAGGAAVDTGDGSANAGSANAGSANAGSANAGSGSAVKPDKAGKGSAAKPADDDDHPRVRVVLDDSSMTFTVPPAYLQSIVDHWACEIGQSGEIDDLLRGRLHILLALIVTGIALSIGLAFYGIKMTHKVAGPLFKVTLYLAKMRDGRLDKVWNLRKGDQLVDFYDHFKSAHAGVVQLEHDDIDRLKGLIAAAETAGVGDSETIVELRAMLARKEKSVE